MAIYKNLLGHSLEKFGAVTVFDATLYDGDIPLKIGRASCRERV